MSGRLRGVLGWTAIVVGLVAFSAYATWPLVDHMGEAVYEDDPLIYTWDLWSVAQSIIHLDNPWWTSSVLSPYGSYLGFHTLSPLVGAVMAPVTLLAGPLTAYNLTKLLLGPAAAIAAYAMGRSLGLPKLASWVTGCVWGFSTIAIWRTDFHMNFGGALPLLPLVIAGAARYERSGRRRDVLLTGVALGAIALVDATMAILAAMALGAWLLIAIWDADRRRLWLRGIGWLAGAALLIAAPQLVMMARTAQQGGYKPNLEVQAATWVRRRREREGDAEPRRRRPVVPREPRVLGLPLSPRRGDADVRMGRARARPRGDRPARGAVAPAPGRRARAPGDPLGRRSCSVVGTVLALGPVLNISGHRRTGRWRSASTASSCRRSCPTRGWCSCRCCRTCASRRASRCSACSGWRCSPASASPRSGRAASSGGSSPWRPWRSPRSRPATPTRASAGRAVPGSRDALYAPVKADKSDSVVVDIPLGFLGATYGAGRSPGKVEPMLRAAQHGHPAAFGSLARLAQPQIDRLVARPFYAALLAQQGTGPEDTGAADGRRPRRAAHRPGGAARRLGRRSGRRPRRASRRSCASSASPPSGGGRHHAVARARLERPLAHRRSARDPAARRRSATSLAAGRRSVPASPARS